MEFCLTGNSGGPLVNTPELLELVTDEAREAVKRGEVEVVPGKVGNKPVVRDVHTKNIVGGMGSGQYPGASDLGHVAKATAYKRTNKHREWIEARLDPEGDENTPGSLPWLFSKAMWAAAGAAQKVDCQHIGCGEKHLVAFKPDGNLIFKLIELVAGKAPATMEMNVDASLSMMIQALNKRDVEVRVITADPDEAIKRAAAIEARFSGAGDSDTSYYDAEFTEVDHDDDASGSAPSGRDATEAVDSVEGTPAPTAD